MADKILMSLPEPRVENYQNDDYFVIQRQVTGYGNRLIKKLGFYPV